MKLTAIILLIVGLAIGTFGGYVYLFSGDYEECSRAKAMAEEKLSAARAARGAETEAALIREARIENDSQEFWCRNAARTEQWSLLSGLGGLAAIIVSGSMLIIARKRAN